MAQPTELDIYNGALAAANATRMATADEDTATGAIVRDLYPSRYRGILDLANWPWATTRSSIGGAASSTNTEYSHKYTLPTTLIRIIGVNGNSNWIQEGGEIHIDDSDGIIVKYVQEAPIAVITGACQQLLTTGLAIDLATAFLKEDFRFTTNRDHAQDEAMARRLAETYELQLRVALGTTRW